MPLSKSVSENIKELSERNKELKAQGKKPRKRSQMVAIALEAAREKGAKIPPPKGG